MKFMMTFNWVPDAQTRAEGLERFRQAAGQPPQGVTLVGRWTRADLSGGYDMLETDDPKKLAEFAYRWSDLMDLEITPILDDAEFSEALKRVMR